jgi:hypothetical protein
MTISNTHALDISRNGSAAHPTGRPAHGRLWRSLGALLSSAMAPTDSLHRRALAAAVRRTANLAYEQRLRAGVVAFADVRREQVQLEHLATLLECGELTSTWLLELIEQIVGQHDKPAETATRLVAVLEAVQHYAGDGEAEPAERNT